LHTFCAVYSKDSMKKYNSDRRTQIMLWIYQATNLPIFMQNILRWDCNTTVVKRKNCHKRWGLIRPPTDPAAWVAGARLTEY
jgi:hypothetical protein